MIGIGLGLKLLGVWGKIKDLFFKYWKITVPIVIAIAGYFYVNHLIDKAYDQGVLDEKTRWEQKVEEKAKENEAFSNQLQTIINNFGMKAVEEAAERAKREEVHTNNIKTIIERDTIYKECKVGDDVIESRNRIREEGPKQ